MDRRGASERGAVTVWMTVVVGLAALTMVWVGRAGRDAVDSSHAQSVADLAAIAAVDGGEPAVRDVARRNRARVLDVRWVGDRVVVRVERDGVVASATATAIVEPIEDEQRPTSTALSATLAPRLAPDPPRLFSWPSIPPTWVGRVVPTRAADPPASPVRPIGPRARHPHRPCQRHQRRVGPPRRASRRAPPASPMIARRPQPLRPRPLRPFLGRMRNPRPSRRLNRCRPTPSPIATCVGVASNSKPARSGA